MEKREREERERERIKRRARSYYNHEWPVKKSSKIASSSSSPRIGTTPFFETQTHTDTITWMMVLDDDICLVFFSWMVRASEREKREKDTVLRMEKSLEKCPKQQDAKTKWVWQWGGNQHEWRNSFFTAGKKDGKQVRVGRLSNRYKRERE